MIIGATAEAAALSAVPDNMYQTNGVLTLMVVPFLAWYWAAMGWMVWGVTRGLASMCRSLPNWMRWGALSLWGGILTVGLALYLISWGFYFHSSQFLNWEAIRFLVGNFHLLWLYVRQTEGRALAGAGALVVLVMGAGIFLRRHVIVARWPVDVTRRLNWRRRCTWYFLGLVWVTMLCAGQNTTDLSLTARRAQAFRIGLNPAMTMAITWIESVLDEKIEPCLDAAQLQPLARDGWWTRPVSISNRVNVIFVTIESMRHDVVLMRHQGHEIVPNVNALAREGLRLTRAYAPATQTDYSTAALFSSLYPLWSRRHLYFSSKYPWPKVLIYDVLKRAGYATAMISSQEAGWGGMDHFLRSGGLDLFYDPTTAGVAPSSSAAPPGEPLWANNIPDAQTAEQCISWIRQHAGKSTPFFLAVNLQSSHFPYTLPAGAESVFHPATVDSSVQFLRYPREKTEAVRNAYYNALHEADRQLGRLVAALRQTGQLDNTILIVCGDHGQAFNENGYVTHAREPIEPVARTACVLYAPRFLQPAEDDYPVELIDLVPTVLSMLGLPDVPNFQGINFLGADRPPLEERLLFLHAENPLARCDAVLLAGRWKYVFDRKAKTKKLFDVVADPNEQRDLRAERPELAEQLQQVLSTWRRRQLAYYTYPTYYERYYPPRPPGWTKTTAQTAGDNPQK